jgi:hypothetical protein
VHFGSEEETEEFKDACPGTNLAPKAEPGQLCIYKTQVYNTTFSQISVSPTGAPGIAPAGVIVEFTPNLTPSEPAIVFGTFAITAPLAS